MHIKEVGYIVERLADRFRDLGGLMAAQEAAHKTALAELRASFNARTASDEHRLENLREEIIRLNDANGRFMVERNGLLTQVQDLRAALAKEQELHAATALRMATDAAKMVEQTWKIGDWVKAPLGTRGEIVEIGNEYICVNIPGEQHPMRWWPKHMCTLCDPPAETCAEPDLTQLHAKGKEAWSDVPNATQWVEEMRGNTEATHDTPEGKDVAESVIRDSRKTEPKPGDVVRLVRVPTLKEYPHDSGCWEPNWGGIDDHMRVHYVGSNITGTRVVRAVFGLEWPLSCVEVVKGATSEHCRRGPKPGDVVRLVRIPSRDVVSPELQTVLEWPWIERWGTLNQTAMVVEPSYQLDGAVSVCLSTNVYVRWPINCLEVVTEATHDTEAGKAVTAVALADVRTVTT